MPAGPGESAAASIAIGGESYERNRYLQTTSIARSARISIAPPPPDSWVVVRDVTLTLTVCDPLPPAPVHVNVKLVVADKTPVVAEPLVASAPLQPPLAVQPVALLEDQVRVEASPVAMLPGLTESDTVGNGGGGGGGGTAATTVTVLDCVPPSPVHDNVKLVGADRVPVAAEPLVARGPLQPPLAVHAVALLDDQTRVDPSPAATLAGLADSDTVGGCRGGGTAAMTVTVLDCVPPSPVHDNVKLVGADRVPVAAEPLVVRGPLQPPLAVHAVALLDDQTRVDPSPAATLAGLADSDTVGGGNSGGVTVTVTLLDPVPPSPVHVSVKPVVTAKGPVVAEPLVAR